MSRCMKKVENHYWFRCFQLQTPGKKIEKHSFVFENEHETKFCLALFQSAAIGLLGVRLELAASGFRLETGRQA